MTYSQIVERSERPTIRVQAPEPTQEEMHERLARLEHQIAILMERRERLLQKINRQDPLQRDRNLAEIMHK